MCTTEAYLVFGSLAATGLPLGLTMVGLVSTFAIMYGLGRIMPVAIWGENFAMMIGMGVGVDYALFIVTRFRQELQQGQAAPEAIKAAMETAGFASLAEEWWHYRDPDSKDWPLLDIPLEELGP